MRVLVTGGAGFIGSHLVDRLVKLGYDVTVIDNLTSGYEKNLEEIKDKITLIRLDISSKKISKYLSGQDIVFHLAAIPDPQSCDKHIEETFKSNVEGTFNILFFSLEKNVKKVIFLSSAHVYGEPQYFPIDENHPTQIYNHYTFSKRLGEITCDFFIKKHNLNIIYFRLFNTYGPKQRPSFFIPTLITQALKRKKIEIWSDKPTRDFIFIDDVVDALVKALDTNFVGGPINLGSGLEIQVGEIAKMISSKLNSELIVLNKEVGGPMRLVCNNAKAKEILNWVPKISFNEGIEKTIDWYKKNLEWFEI
jgi:nucleoside-diphosphate-sugar epimerase